MNTSKKNLRRHHQSASGFGIFPPPLRDPTEPTEYEKAAARRPPKALDDWVRANWQRRWVPAEALDRLGLRHQDWWDVN